MMLLGKDEDIYSCSQWKNQVSVFSFCHVFIHQEIHSHYETRKSSKSK